MSNHIESKIWLVGVGLMGTEYAKVLQSQNMAFEAIGRGPGTAASFTDKTGIPVHQGGLRSWLRQADQTPDVAIVAVNVEQLAETALLLLGNGVKRILLEKPAGTTLNEITQVAIEAEKRKAEVYVAYNRRFYASTIKAEEIIANDSGVTSFIFEFTEWSHEIVGLKKDPRVKANWFLANSTHVVDLAFYLGGTPKKMSCYKTGGLSWHPSASIFAGAGVTSTGALFSYHANWEAPGRWGVEILTRNHRLILRPLEKLQIQSIGSATAQDVILEDELDVKFKPGLFLQVQAFLTGRNAHKLDTIAAHRQLAQEVFWRMVHPKETGSSIQRRQESHREES